MTCWHAENRNGSHPKVRHGRCPTCGHYGEDCTGGPSELYQDEAGTEYPFEVEPEHTIYGGDGAALDQIAAHLTGREWNAEDIEIVAAFVRATGRVIAEPDA